MAFTVSLVRVRDTITDVSSLSLLNFTNSFSLNSWNQAARDEGPVTELFSVDLKDTSHDLIAAALQSFEEYMRLAAQAKRTPARDAIWLRAQTSGETGGRQSLVYGGGYPEPLAFYAPPMSPGNQLQDIKLSVDRAPWWETTTAQLFEDIVISACGGVSSTLAVSGSLPGRIAEAILVGVSSATLTDFWGGFITDDDGLVFGDFTCPWELESGTPGTDAATGSDATCHGNSKIAVTFATVPTLASRVTLTPYQISSTHYDMLRGTFNILMRAKCASGVTARARLACGMGSSWMYNNLVTITGTTDKFYPMGQVTLPSGGPNMEFSDLTRNTTLKIEAELTAGAAGANALDMDCLIPIPAQYNFHIGGGSGAAVYVSVGEFGRVTGYGRNGGGLDRLLDLTGMEARTAMIPKGNCRLILAAQRSAGSTLADDANVDLVIRNRYGTLRGAG